MGHTEEKRVTRSLSPSAPGTPPRQAVAGAGKKPWVVADWKHRVPRSRTKHQSCSAAPTLHTQQRAALVAERKRQLSAEFAVAHETIDRMLARCKLVQDTLHVNYPNKRSNSSSGGSTSSSLQPSTPRPEGGTAPAHGVHMHLTMRSQLLFEASNPQPASSSDDGFPMEGSCTPAAPSHSRPHDQQQQQQQQQSRQQDAWRGAVDLNPGFNFRPGTPQRATAVLRGARQPSGINAAGTAAAEGPTAEPRLGASPAAFVPGSCSLTHRESLQAGIQEWTGAFYAGLREQKWQQHHQARQQLGQQADVIPVSWFGAA